MYDSASVGICAAAGLAEMHYDCPQCTELMRKQCLSPLLEVAVEKAFAWFLLHPSN